MTDKSDVHRSSNAPNKYELIIVAAKEARRMNELSRQTGLSLGAKVTNVALEEALKGDVLYRFEDVDTVDAEPAAAEETEE